MCLPGWFQVVTVVCDLCRCFQASVGFVLLTTEGSAVRDFPPVRKTAQAAESDGVSGRAASFAVLVSVADTGRLFLRFIF